MILPIAAESIGVGPAGADIAASVAFHLGLAALTGAGVVALLDRPRDRLRRAAPLAWSVAAIGALGIGWMRLTDFDLGVRDFVTGYTLGKAAAMRLGGLAIAWIGVVLLARAKPRAAIVVLAGAGIAAFGHAMGGHANIGAVPWLARTWHAVHTLAIGAWIGGLAAMLLSVRGEPDAAKARLVRRFSRIAGFLIVVVVATGILRAMDTVGFSLDALTRTSYGRLVLLKSELLLLLAAFGAHNRWHEVPRAHRVLRGLRRFGIAELATATIVFTATGVLAGTEPAAEAVRQLDDDTPPPVTQLDEGVTIESRDTPDGVTLYSASWPDGTTAQAYLDPQAPGRNELHVTLFTPQGNEHQLSRFLTFPGLSTPAWQEPVRFSKGHFTIAAELAGGEEAIYAFNAIAPGDRGRWRLVLPLQIGS